MRGKNPYARDPDTPYVKLAEADWFIAGDIRRDGFPDIQIREVIKVTRRGVARYAGYGLRVKVNGSTGDRIAKFVPLDPDDIPPEAKAELDDPQQG